MLSVQHDFDNGESIDFMLKRLDLYILVQIGLVSVVIASILTGVMLMTQSLRFLDLIITSGASGVAFITLSLLALPRFFEVIVPLALVTGAVFTYIKLREDCELTVMQTAGIPPFRLAWPAILLGLVFAVLMFGMLGWVAPKTLAYMQELRQILKVQYSAALFREGVFNTVGENVTVYVEQRLDGGGLKGLVIHDGRDAARPPVTVTAQSGQLLMTDQGQQILVFNGVRQTRNGHSGGLERLQFDRYMIDLPDPGPVQKRWAEPEERTLSNLLFLSPNDPNIVAYYSEFRAEIHRRFLSPLLGLSFVMTSVAMVLFMPFRRTPSARDVLGIAGVIIALQGAYIGVFSVAKTDIVGVVLMYIIALVPGGISGALLAHRSRLSALIQSHRGAVSS
jgi:lipopolysaccharide export system permease protein